MFRYSDHIEKLRAAGALRQLREVDYRGNEIFCEGRWMVNLSSNDYLGLGADTALWETFLTERGRETGGGSCSSRLLTGNHPAYRSLEEKLRTAYGKSGALVLGSGYHANLGILPALATSKDLILADKLVHASLIDGMRLGAAEFVRFAHNDMAHLEKLLAERRERYEKIFIVTEAVFSMDGDCAPLAELVALKKKYGCLLYLDEAHSVGVRGERGLGLAEEAGLIGEVDLLMGTFGKAFASQGAFLIADEIIIEYLVNTMRPLIFSTALPPISVAWSEWVFEKMPEFGEKRKYLAAISEKLRDGLTAAELETGGASQIVPLIVRDNARAVAMGDYLQANGFFALPIRPPTVPAGSERIRLSLRADVTGEQLKQFTALCRRFGH